MFVLMHLLAFFRSFMSNLGAEEGQRMHWSKCFEYNNEDEDNSPNILNDKTCQASSKKFRQIISNCKYYSIQFEPSY